jgi:hypothetical protein
MGLGLVVGLYAGCSDTNGTGDGGPKKEGGAAPDLPPAPELVTFKKAGESAEADFEQAKEYVVVPYSVSETAADAIEFTVKVTSGSGMGSQSFKLRVPSRRPVDPVFLARWQQRMKVERWLRGLAEQAAASPHSRPPEMTTPLAGAACVSSTDGKCEANEVCFNKVCSSQLTIKTEKFSSTKTITANVKAKGKRAAVLVDSADTVDQGTIDSLLKRFEEIILPRSVALFGDPPLQGSSGPTASDRNGDGLVWLVLTKKVQEKKAVGFFVATDFTDEAASNKADILYIDAAAKTDSALVILAHELQHLLGYGSKVYKPTVNGQTGGLEALWLDEGQAHFAEDACGFGGENTTLLRQQTLTGFSEKSLLFTQDDIAARGMAFLFVRYLFEQKGAVTYNADGSITDAGGAAFLKAIHSTTKQGVEAVKEALGSTFSGDWKAGFDNWMVAMTLDGRGLTQYPRYVYAALQDDPKTNNQIGVKIRGERKDETGAVVKLEGPLEDEITATGDTAGQIPNATGKFFLLKSMTGKVNVSVTTQETDFRFALIRLKQQ